MERYLSYVSPYDPELRSRLRGAGPDQLAELAAVAGRPLPTFYSQYLRHAGLDDGGIRLAIEGTTNVDEIIGYYREEVLTGQDYLPPGCILMGVGAVSILNLALDCSASEEPPVVFVNGDKVDGRYADSLEGLLFILAFSRYKLRSYAYLARYAASYNKMGRQHRLPAARFAAQKLGFKPTWFSDNGTSCSETPQAALVISQAEGRGFSFRIASNSTQEIAHLVEQLCLDLDFAATDWKVTATQTPV